MTHRYAFQGYDADKMAKVVGRDLPVSTKQCIEICTFIRGRKLQKAKDLMQEVIDMKAAVPFNRFPEGAGHKRGSIASGRYPVKAAGEILVLLESVEANAQQKGLSSSNLIVKHACANQASRPPKYGRIRGLLAKRSHVEIVVTEEEESKDKDKGKQHKNPAKTPAQSVKQEKTMSESKDKKEKAQPKTSAKVEK